MKQNFLNADSGAVTVDWVVMSAALVGLGLATMGVVSSGVEDLSTDTSDHLRGIEITTEFEMDCSSYSADCLWAAAQAYEALTGDGGWNSQQEVVDEVQNMIGGSDSQVARLAFANDLNGDLGEGFAAYELMKDYTGTAEDQLALAQVYGLSSVAELEAAIASEAGIDSMEQLEDMTRAKGDVYGQLRLAAIDEANARGLTADDI